MMNETLEIVATKLNEHLKTTINLIEDKCIVSNLVNIDKSIPSGIQNKVVISFIHLEESHLRVNAIGYKGLNNESEIKRMEFSILVSFNFDSYSESLKFLTNTFSFFQSNPVLLMIDEIQDSTITKLMMNHINMNTESISTIWSFIGIPYLPSLMYKIQVLYR